VRISGFQKRRRLHRKILPIAISARRVVYSGFQTARLSLRLILRRMRQRTLVLEHLAKIAAVYPAPAGWAGHEMLGLFHRLSAKRPTEVFSASHGHQCFVRACSVAITDLHSSQTMSAAS
jgi:hypothetical protein